MINVNDFQMRAPVKLHAVAAVLLWLCWEGGREPLYVPWGQELAATALREETTWLFPVPGQDPIAALAYAVRAVEWGNTNIGMCIFI